jgi:hypothetical protein
MDNEVTAVEAGVLIDQVQWVLNLLGIPVIDFD